MPGFCGGVGVGSLAGSALLRNFQSVWPTSHRATFNGGFLVAHAFGGGRALHESANGYVFAVDGQRDLYRDGGRGIDAYRFFRMFDQDIRLAPGCTGNVAVFDPSSLCWHLATDWSGSFPLFYTQTADGLLFSSLQKPLASAISAAWDPVGIVEFLRDGYTVAGRSQHTGIHRLLPGQTLKYDPATLQLRLREKSKAWSGIAMEPTSSRERTAEASWKQLVHAAQLDLVSGHPHAVMMSGGWDSRTLLAALREGTPADQLLGYTHGDLQSRELQLVGALCDAAGVRLHGEPLTEALYDPDRLHGGFQRVENVIFPHWHRAGAVLAGYNADAVSAGVYGEVLGGHYGPAMRLEGAAKMRAVAGALLGQSTSTGDLQHEFPRIVEFFRPSSGHRLWYLARDYWESVPTLQGDLEADIRWSLQRIANRGVVTADQLVEAFITEHRGTQYINAQLLSCRASVDISLPFAAQPILERVTRIPLQTKIHNALNRVMLRQHAPDLLELPFAATLVPARAPLLVQEGSRLARSVLETAKWKLHSASAGRLASPRYGWLNLEFLRRSEALPRLVDDLRAGLWDQRALQRRVQEARATPAGASSIHPLVFQLLTIYTVDLMLRSPGR